MKPAVLGCTVLACLGHASMVFGQVLPPPNEASFGPLRLGMNADEARQALPNAKVTVSTLYEQPAAFEFAGVAVDVRFDLDSLEGGPKLELSAKQSVRPGGCRARIEAMITALEPEIGPLHPDEFKGYTLVRAGVASRYGWFTSKSYSQEGLVQSSAFIRENEGPIKASVQANEDWNPELRQLECVSRIVLRRVR